MTSTGENYIKLPFSTPRLLDSCFVLFLISKRFPFSQLGSPHPTPISVNFHFLFSISSFQAMRWKKPILLRSFNSRRQPTLGKSERTDSRSQGCRLGRSYQSSVSLLSWEERAFRQFLLLVRFLTVNPTTGDEGGRYRPFPGCLGAGERPLIGVSHRFEIARPQARVSNCNHHQTLLKC